MTMTTRTRHWVKPYGSGSIHSTPEHAPFPLVTASEAAASERFNSGLRLLVFNNEAQGRAPRLSFEEALAVFAQFRTAAEERDW